MIKYILIGIALIGFALLHGIAISTTESGSTTDVSIVLRDVFTMAWALVSLILCVTLALVFESEFPPQD